MRLQVCRRITRLSPSVSSEIPYVHVFDNKWKKFELFILLHKLSKPSITTMDEVRAIKAAHLENGRRIASASCVPGLLSAIDQQLACECYNNTCRQCKFWKKLYRHNCQAMGIGSDLRIMSVLNMIQIAQGLRSGNLMVTREKQCPDTSKHLLHLSHREGEEQDLDESP
jgi:hypothetical protein